MMAWNVNQGYRRRLAMGTTAVAGVMIALVARIDLANAIPGQQLKLNNPFFFMSAAEMNKFGTALERLTRIPKEITDVRCNGIDNTASRGSGAAYYWCKGVLLGTPNPVGLSYGVQSWDTWSRYMSEQYQVPTRLFDCFTKGADEPIPQYPVPYERFDECLDVSERTDEKARVFKTIGSQLSSREPLSTFVKIDIEGMEWAVLEAMTDEEFSKIALLDLEIHWCLTMQDDSPARILAVMRRLLQQFAVVGRLSEGDWLNGVGCDKTTEQTSMMSVSYVNKAAMFGRIVKEATASLTPGSVSKGACRGHDMNVTAGSGRPFVLCRGYVANPTQWHRAPSLTALAVVRTGTASGFSAHMQNDYSLQTTLLTCGTGASDASEVCPTRETAGVDVAAAVTAKLAAAEPLSVVLMLDLSGLEWNVLHDLTDDSLDRVHSLLVAMDFCSSAHSFQSISQILRRLQKRFMIIGRDFKGGLRQRCGCLQGQQKQITVSYMNKRGRHGKYEQFPLTREGS